MSFEIYLDSKIKNAISSLETDRFNDMFGFALGIILIDDDMENFMLLPMINTVKNVEERKCNASSEAEAKWNYAFWIHLSKNTIFSTDDSLGLAIRDEWVAQSAPISQRLYSAIAKSIKKLKDQNSDEKFFDDAVPLLFCNLNDVGNNNLIYRHLIEVNPNLSNAVALWKIYSL